MDRIYITLREIQNGTKSPKQLFLNLEKLLNINLPNFQIFINDLASDVYISFLGGNDKPTYGDIILTDKGRDYIKHNKHLAGNPSEFKGPCNIYGEMKCKEYFIRDLNDLCRTCFARTKVENIRANMIMKFEIIQSVTTKDTLISHLNENIIEATKNIEEVINHENSGDPMYRENRVCLLISWKDCLQYYNEQLSIINEVKKHTEKNTILQGTQNTPRFYTEKDFQKIVDDLPDLDPKLQVTDYLDLHYSQAKFTGLMSKMNWFTMLRKTLFKNGFKDYDNKENDLPEQIRTAFWWGQQKTIQLLKDNPVGVKKKTVKPNDEYTLGDYALMQVYLSISEEGEGVTNANKSEIAGRYSIHAKRFYEDFNKYTEANARTETINKRSDKEKKKRFEKVIKLLAPFPKALKRATDEQKVFLNASLKTYEY